MSKANVSKKPSFIKSIFSHVRKRKKYYRMLEADFSQLKLENAQLKKQLFA